MKKNNKKSFIRKKSPEQEEAELIMQELKKERMLHALETTEVPIRLPIEVSDSDDRINLTTTSKTKYVMCTVEVEDMEIFNMIDDDIQNLLKQAKECYVEYNRMQRKYAERAIRIIEKKNISDKICFTLAAANDYISLKEMEEFYAELEDELDD
jgi:hypothetical protein